MAEGYCSTVLNSTLNRDRKPPLWEIKKAIEYDPFNAQYHDKLSRYYIRLQVKDKDLRVRINEKIIKSLEKAVSLNPVNGIYWYDLGVRYSYKVYEGNEYFTMWLPKADKAFELAEYFRPNDAYMLYNLGWYWVWRSTTVRKGEDGRLIEAQSSKLKAERQKPSASSLKPQAVFYREDGSKKFQELFKRSLEINKKYWKKAVERVWKYYPDERIVMGIVPVGDRLLGSQVGKWISRKKDRSHFKTSDRVRGQGEGR